MAKEQTLVLDTKKVAQKINRIAHELYENNFREKEIIVIGVSGRGYDLARRIQKVLLEISDLAITLAELKLDKDHPLSSTPELSIDQAVLNKKNVVLIDDVLQTGKTLIYAAKCILDAPVKKLSTVVLVDRKHRAFPIKADIVGLTLSTTVQERIAVNLNKGKEAVYLE